MKQTQPHFRVFDLTLNFLLQFYLFKIKESKKKKKIKKKLKEKVTNILRNYNNRFLYIFYLLL